MILRLDLPFWRYPVFACKALLRRFFLSLAHDIPLTRRGSDEAWAARDEALPSYLSQFTRGELLKWKGVEFRVLKVVGDPSPGLILVPTASTHGQRIAAFRAIRREQVKERRHVDS